jgi:hypothetical protein
MKRVFVAVLTVVGLLWVSSTGLRAEVKTEEKTQMKFAGAMGRVMGMFGGKAAREGTINTVAVKGNRMMTVNDTTGEIIDLDEQKIYNLDMKKKTYEVMTFEEMRKRMEEAREKAAQAVQQQEPKKEENAPADKQMELEFSLKESGQKKTINGYDCREVVMTITGHEKGKTVEESGGMVTTSHIWLAPAIPELKEIDQFQRRYAEALQGSFSPGESAQQMAMVTAMYPAMKDMMGKMEMEKVNMDGAQILTETIMETIRTEEQMAQDRQKEPEPPTMSPIGGIGGLLARKMARKKEEKKDDPGNSPPGKQVTLLTTNHELFKVSTSVSATDLTIPAGFKEKK